MILKQYYLGCLSHASYLVGDEASGAAVIVDPQRDVDQYVRDAAALGLTITDVVLTHYHADFVAGHLELKDRTGASISLGPGAAAEYPHQERHEGDAIVHGNTRLEVLETPGHTPEGISLVAYDLGKDPAKPQAVLTGDTLFVGDVGRPDLMASSGHSAEALAGNLYDSLHGKLLALPDDTLVYPAHGPGSLCGSGGSTDRVSSIGRERRENPALQDTSKEAFVARVTADLPEVPPYFARDAALNKVERSTLGGPPAPLSTEAVVLLQNQGAQVLDVRNPDDFAAGHLQGSLNVGIDGRFAQWAATVLDATRPVVLVTPPGREAEAAMRLGRVGIDNVAGFLQDAIPAHLTERVPRATAQEVADALQSDAPPALLDVRSKREFDGGHIQGAVNIPLTSLKERLAEVPAGPVVVYCQSGYRSSIATSLLRKSCRPCYTDMIGGIAAWEAAGLPISHP
ncbi:MAG: MBL fold metallo-hydrolase [Armatimonadetes bacterium]|nr:MBL fold metallo-hydrolase [Armatimonadota bacterium]